MIKGRLWSQPGRFESRLCIDLTFFVMLEKVLNFFGLSYFVYKMEAVMGLTSRVVLGLSELVGL